MDQQALIAIRQGELPAAPGHQPFQPAGAGVVAVQGEAEIGRALLRPGDMRGNRSPPPIAQPGVGVQQQQPVLPCGGNAGGQLHAPATGCGDHARARGNRANSAVIRTAAIYDDNLRHRSTGQAPEHRRQEPGGIQHRDHNGDPDRRGVHIRQKMFLFCS